MERWGERSERERRIEKEGREDEREREREIEERRKGEDEITLVASEGNERNEKKCLIPSLMMLSGI